jgi:hypothetical protein
MPSPAAYFDLSPRIVPAAQASQITIRSPFGHRQLQPGAAYTLHAYPMGGLPGPREVRLMLAHTAGNPDAASALGKLSGRAAALYDHLWGRA